MLVVEREEKGVELSPYHFFFFCCIETSKIRCKWRKKEEGEKESETTRKRQGGQGLSLYCFPCL